MTQLFKGLEQIEEARERISGESFMSGLFAGKPDFSLLLTPVEPAEQKAAWEEFRPKLERFLIDHVDPDLTMRGLMLIHARNVPKNVKA